MLRLLKMLVLPLVAGSMIAGNLPETTTASHSLQTSTNRLHHIMNTISAVDMCCVQVHADTTCQRLQ